jgi:hypothetical protein
MTDARLISGCLRDNDPVVLAAVEPIPLYAAVARKP